MKWKRKGKQVFAMMLAVATLLSGCAPNGIYADEEPLLLLDILQTHGRQCAFLLDFIGFPGLKKVRVPSIASKDKNGIVQLE